MLVKPKDPVPLEQQNRVIYRIRCRDCESTYVGQSGHSFACRMKEDQKGCERRYECLCYCRTCMHACMHAWGHQHQHQIDWGAAEVMDSNLNWCPTCLLESWHIHKELKVMNRDRGNLPRFSEICDIPIHHLFIVNHHNSILIPLMKIHEEVSKCWDKI